MTESGSAPFQSVIRMIEYWSNVVLSAEKEKNGWFAEFYNGEINGIIQNSLKTV